MKRSLIILAAASIFAGCSTELEVNAPYKDITVVYGLLNMRDSVHFVKINKAFLGEGDALVYAQIPDSNEYRDEDITRAMIFQLNASGQRVDSFPLQDTLIDDREPGVFYAPEQRLYYFTGPTYQLPVTQLEVYLNQDHEYELDLVVKGKQVSARTSITNDFNWRGILASTQEPLRFFNNQGYSTQSFPWRSGVDGKRYEISWRFNYTEVKNGQQEHRSITQRLGTRVSSNTSISGEELDITYSGEQFFSTIANLVPTDPAVEQRIFTGMDILMAVANDEFHTIISLSEPVSGIVEERPAYSNVENGYGIFASRYTKDIYGKQLDGITLQELVSGQYTADKKFCYMQGENLICD